MSPAPRSLKRDSGERRDRRRFDFSSPLRYILSGIEGQGQTINISSVGVLIQVPQKLPPHRRIILYIDWPAKLDSRILLQLVIKGRTVRGTGTLVAIAIQSYEFRICAGKLAFIAAPQS